MRKILRVLMTPVLPILLVLIVGSVFQERAEAKSQKKSTKSKKASASRTTAKKKASRKTSKSANRRTVARKSVSSKKRSARSKTTARKRSNRRSRSRALYLARLRALRARDAGLRNIAAANINKDNSSGEDLDIRRIAVDALKGRSGTVVVMDPNNGRVFTVVNQQMALGTPVKPCSTIKLVVGLAALHESVFDPNQDVRISSRASMNLTDCLARSNNPVFQVLGRMLGFERVINYAQNFGLGETTGINYPGESNGFIPEEGEYETGHMSSHGDGFGVTAIQLAAFTSAIANGGNLYVPRVPRTPDDANFFEPVLKRRIEMSSEERMRLMAGMMGAVNFGTARLAHNPLGQVAGKTGTCTGNRDRLGLFTSFSSAGNPKVVVTVITTGSTEAGRRAAEIAGRIYAEISPRFFNESLAAPASAGTEINDFRN